MQSFLQEKIVTLNHAFALKIINPTIFKVKEVSLEIHINNVKSALKQENAQKTELQSHVNHSKKISTSNYLTTKPKIKDASYIQ